MKYMMLIADSEDGMPQSNDEERATYARIGASLDRPRHASTSADSR